MHNTFTLPKQNIHRPGPTRHLSAVHERNTLSCFGQISNNTRSWIKMAIYGRSDIHAARIMTLETRTGNHFSIWSNAVVNVDTMTWRRGMLLRNRLAGGWNVSAS
jgi:hypothetical protein